MKQYLNVCFKMIMAFLPVIALSQDLPEVIPPSPTVASLMHLEEIPADYYTGQPNISIPMFSKSINSGIGIGIALNYSTQGVKINNRSGWTGTGWSLSAGGSISRTVRGLPDEMKRNTALIVGEGILHNNDYWNYDSLTQTEKERFQWRAAGTPADVYDTEPDLFQYNFMGTSGRFIIVKEGNGLVAKNLDKSQNIKIEIQYNNNPLSNDYYKLLAFNITDLMGYKYTFDVVEKTSSQPFIAVTLHDQQNLVNGSSQDYMSDSAWHISKIETPNSDGSSNGILASFNYTTSFEAYTASIMRTYSRPINHDTSLWNTVISVPYNASVLIPKEVHSYLTLGITTKKLQSINFKDGTSIGFEISSNNHPETNGDILEYIRIYDENSIEDRHFKFDYSIGNRLWLTQINEVAGANTNTYNLSYNDKESLAPFDSPNETDDWGYFKDYTSVHCGLLQSNTSVISTGLLKQIVYPTGGATEFEFEPHQISFQGQNQLTDNEYRDKNPDNWDTKQVNATYYNSFGSPNPNAPSFTLTQEQELSLNILSLSGDQDDIFNTNVQIWDSNNATVQSFALDTPQTFNLDAGTYTVHFITPSISPNVTTEVCVGYKDFLPSLKRYIYGGGVRIKSIKFKDDPNDNSSAREFNYDYKDDLDITKSSGSIDGLLTGLVRNYNQKITRHLLPEECPIDDYNTGPLTFEFAMETESLNIQITKGQYVGYKTITVEQTGNGYTKYTHTSAQDHFSPDYSYVYPYPLTEDLDYLRGLLTKVETFDNNNKILREVNNTYSHEKEAISKAYKYHELDCAWKNFYTYYDDWIAGTNDLNMSQCYIGVSDQSYPATFQIYDIYTKRVINVSKMIHSNASAGCERDCIGVYETCSIYDLSDYYFNLVGGIQPNIPYEFYENNINATWVKLDETINKEYFFDANGNNQTTKETRQVFTYNDDNYQIKTQDTYYKVKGVDEHLKVQYNYPVGPYTANNTDNTGPIRSKLAAQNKVTEVLETQFYRNGVMINETHNIYADFDTSANDLMLPKEVKVGKGTLSPEKRIEFLKYDSYANPTEVKKTDGTSIIYLYGFNGAVPVAKITNASFNTVSSVLNGATSFTGNMSSSQENSLRNSSSLSGAMISFYRYDPLIGVISTVDDKGYTTTYEYDAFNRLVRVKDAQGNILGENTYHYKNQ
ncbi:RHS repeat protein [uncultured Winogradskyella sp.]|uniref:RHS repeat protein n=1 Tax=uncultured Winogradskyella sp. TaxID=395353 RepID=UPI00263A29D7|nr:RHS repeat domain-containing protein [uncultured Winogradskyella sp.]